MLPIARKWHGVIPVWYAVRQGVDASQLRRWAASNDDVAHPARGVYVWLTDDPSVDWRHTDTALTLAQAGPDAALWGPTVVQMAGLGGWGSPVTHIAVTGRRASRPGVRWHRDTGFARTTMHGLPVEDAALAVRDGLPYMDWDKRALVLADSVDRGILTETEADRLADA